VITGTIIGSGRASELSLVPSPLRILRARRLLVCSKALDETISFVVRATCFPRYLAPRVAIYPVLSPALTIPHPRFCYPTLSGRYLLCFPSLRRYLRPTVPPANALLFLFLLLLSLQHGSGAVIDAQHQQLSMSLDSRPTRLPNAGSSGLRPCASSTLLCVPCRWPILGPPPRLHPTPQPAACVRGARCSGEKKQRSRRI
jgi:hypothetical protein